MNLSLSEKYRVKKFTDLIGQEPAINEIKQFIREFPKKRALILHGPAGTGKTSLVIAAAKENNLDILELNASDLRNKKQLEQILKPASAQMSLFQRGKILLMDEVDGVTGTDIGGIPELIRVIETTSHPMIMTCNDVWQSKLSQVRTKSKMVEMKPLDLGTMVSLLSIICEKENIRKEPIFLKQIAIKAQGDVRAALNDLQAYSEGDSIIDIKERRDVEDSIFNILKRLFKEREPFLEIFDSSSLSIDEIFLWLEENIPKEYKNETLVRAYSALSKADVFRGRIYKNNSYRFLIYQNVFQSAGISFAKKMPLPQSFTRYERPKRVLKIWMHNQKTEKKKSIAKKLAKYAHCSTRRAMRDFELLTPLLRKPEIQRDLKMSEEEIEFLTA
jgi:replication factor C large subunit